MHGNESCFFLRVSHASLGPSSLFYCVVHALTADASSKPSTPPPERPQIPARHTLSQSRETRLAPLPTGRPGLITRWDVWTLRAGGPWSVGLAAGWSGLWRALAAGRQEGPSKWNHEVAVTAKMLEEIKISSCTKGPAAAKAAYEAPSMQDKLILWQVFALACAGSMCALYLPASG